MKQAPAQGERAKDKEDVLIGAAKVREAAKSSRD
jgi:hypothetical protein